MALNIHAIALMPHWGITNKEVAVCTEQAMPEFKSERDKFASDEATRDPIFLFQSRSYIYGETPYGCFYCSDCEGTFREEEDDHLNRHNEEDFEGEGILTNKELVDMGVAREVWHTELVFYSREEGADYGANRDYNYPDGWRVWCVPCEGRLVKALMAHEEAVDLYAKVKRMAERAYIDYSSKNKKPGCLGVFAKIKDGTFGFAELNCHEASQELLGKHRAYSEVFEHLFEIFQDEILRNPKQGEE